MVTTLPSASAATVTIHQNTHYVFLPDRLSDDLKRLGPWRKEDKSLYVPGDTQLGLLDIVCPGESAVPGGEMMKRASEVNSAGQGYAETLARNHRIVPQEWRGMNLLFPRTVWYNAHDHAYIPVLQCCFRLVRFSFLPAGEVYDKLSKLVHITDHSAAN